MQTTIAFVLLFCLRTTSLAADVTVYQYVDYYNRGSQKFKPIAVSQFPWQFGYLGSDYFDMFIHISNKSSSLTAISFICTTDDRTFEVEKSAVLGWRYGEEFYYIPANTFLKSTEVNIKINLFTSNILCSSLVVAKGRDITNITNEPLQKEFPYYGSRLNFGCVLVVDLINICDGPPLATDTNMDTTTENAGTDGETINPNNTYTFNSSTNLEIMTHKNSTIDTDACKTNYTIIIIAIISSISGTLLVQLVIIVIWVRRCSKRSPSGTPQLPANQANPDPFYLNMLFRRECDQEIAEIEQHQYEEIVPQVTEGG